MPTKQKKVVVPVMSAETLADHLEMLELNQLELARLLNISPRRVRYWIADERPVPTEIAMLLNLMVRTATKPEELRTQ